MMGVAVLSASVLTTGIVRDSATEHQRLQALFIAESAIERASYRFNNGTACSQLGETNVAMGTLGAVTITPFTTAFDGTTSVGASCRIRATATTSTGQVVRTIESFITQTSFSSRGNRAFTCDVPSGSNGLVVSVTWTTSSAVDYTIYGVSFNGFAMTPAADPANNSVSGSRYKSQNFWLLNPSTGTSIDGTLTMSGDPNTVVVGCTSLSGVTTINSTPVDATATQTGNNDTPSVTVTTSSNSGTRFVIDAISRDNGGNLTMTAATGRAEAWNFTSSGAGSAGSNRGAASGGGVIGASTSVTMGWTWNQSKGWADSAIAVFATFATGNGARVRMVGTGSGVTGWREITVPPS